MEGVSLRYRLRKHNDGVAALLTGATMQDGTQHGVAGLRTDPTSDFLCSFCGKRKGDANDWLLGFEGSKQKSLVMKYTITLLGKWDEQRACEPNAVHFCSTACQERYLSRNYGDETL